MKWLCAGAVPKKEHHVTCHLCVLHLIYCEMTIETAVLARVISLSGTLSPRENLKIFEGIKIMSKGAMVELQDPGKGVTGA